MKSVILFFVLFVNVFCHSHKYGNENEDWKGSYIFASKNRDGLKTSFEINIVKLDNISIKYMSDGGKVETYKNLTSNFVQKNKVKIIFNQKYKDMGIIYIEKSDNEYFISGSPIYFINPGNEDMPLKKIE